MGLSMKGILNIDINLETISKQNLQNKELSQISILNSVIKESSFRKVDMSRCDILSTKIFNSTFEDVYFGGADLSSLWISDCNFNRVDFSNASVYDITFLNCTFKDCIFGNVELKRCSFSNTEFVNIRPDSSSFTLNTYNYCKFSYCDFKGTFYLQIFKECKFKNVNLDYNALKYNYGIYNNSGVTFVNKKQEKQNSEQLYNLLKLECESQQLSSISSMIVDFNFYKRANCESLIEGINFIETMIGRDVIIRNDELHFLRNLYHHLYTERIITPIILYKVFKMLQEIYMKWQSCKYNISFAKCKDELYMLSNSLYFDFSNFCEELREKIIPITECTYPIFIDIHYNHEPKKEISTILNKYPNKIFRRVSIKDAYFCECFEAGKNGLEILKIFMELLGITDVPIIYTEFDEKKEDLGYTVFTEDKKVDMSELIQLICKLVDYSDVCTEGHLCYNKENIKEICVRYSK